MHKDKEREGENKRTLDKFRIIYKSFSSYNPLYYFSRWPFCAAYCRKMKWQEYHFRSKLVSLLRRLSPRLSRPGSKGSLQSSPTICPWVQVEYSTESIEGGKREESQENDASFQQELQLNELRKRMAGIASTSQVIANLRVPFRLVTRNNRYSNYELVLW